MPLKSFTDASVFNSLTSVLCCEILPGITTHELNRIDANKAIAIVLKFFIAVVVFVRFVVRRNKQQKCCTKNEKNNKKLISNKRVGPFCSIFCKTIKTRMETNLAQIVLNQVCNKDSCSYLSERMPSSRKILSISSCSFQRSTVLWFSSMITFTRLRSYFAA